MADIADLIVRISADLKQLEAGLAQAGALVGGFGKSVEKSAATAASGLRVVSVVAGVAGLALAAALGLAVKAAADAQREQTLLRTAIEGSARAAELSAEAFQAQAQALQRLTGFSDEAITSVQSMLVTFNLTQEQIEQLTPRVLNIAAFYGRDLKDAALQVGRAMTVSLTALRRTGVVIDQSLDPTRDFAAVLRAIDRNTGDAARALATTLPGAIARVRNAIDDLMEAGGAPLLQTLTNIVNAVGSMVFAFNDLLTRFPALAGAMTLLTTATAALLLGTGGIAALRFVLGQLRGSLGLITSSLTGAGRSFLRMSVGARDAEAAMASLSGGVRGMIAGAGGLGPLLAQIGLRVSLWAAAIAAAVTLVVRNWDVIAPAIKDALREVSVAISEFVRSLRGIFDEVRPALEVLVGAFRPLLVQIEEKFVLALLTAAEAVAGFAQVAAGLAQVLRGDIVEGLQTLALGLERVADAADRAAERLALVRAFRKTDEELTRRQAAAQAFAAMTAARSLKSLDQLEQAYKDAAAAAELASAREQRAAAARARIQLQAPGLSKADVEAIEAARETAESAAIQRALRRRIDARRAELAEGIRNGEVFGTKRLEIEQDIVRMEIELHQKASADIKRIVGERVDAEEDAAKQRIATEAAVARARVDLERGTLEQERAILEQREAAEVAAGERQLTRFRELEELRLGMYRRVLETERTLSEGIFTIRESLLRAETAKEERLLVERNNRRAELVRVGLISEETARAAAAEEELAIALRTAQAEFRLAQDRLAAQERLDALEVAFLKSAVQSKIRLLEVETAARIRQIQSTLRLRESELRTSVRIAQLETVARVAELRAQTSAEIREIQARLAARTAAGEMTPGEAAQRGRLLASVQASAAAEAASLLQRLAIQERATEEQLSILREQAAQDIVDVTEQAAIRRRLIEQELQSSLVDLEVAGAQKRAAAIEQIAGLQLRVTEAGTRAAEALRAQGILMEESIRQRIAGVDQLVRQMQSVIISPFPQVDRASLDAIMATVSQVASTGPRIIEVLQRTGQQAVQTVESIGAGGSKIIEVIGTAGRQMGAVVERASTQAVTALGGLQGAAARVGTVVQASLAPLGTILGGAEFDRLVAGLSGKLASVVTLYQQLGTSVAQALQPAITALERIITLRTRIQQLPAPPTVPAVPSPGTRTQAVPGAGAQANVNIPLVVDGRVIGEVALRFIEGRLAGWLATVPSG